MDKYDYKKFINDPYSGRELLSKHSLSDYGFWMINGADTNCDMSGSHVKPYMLTVEGQLEDVIRYAVNLPNFWSWGSPGSITKVNVLKVGPDTSEKIAELKASISQMEEDLEDKIKELKNLSSNR